MLRAFSNDATITTRNHLVLHRIVIMFCSCASTKSKSSNLKRSRVVDNQPCVSMMSSIGDQVVSCHVMFLVEAFAGATPTVNQMLAYNCVVVNLVSLCKFYIFVKSNPCLAALLLVLVPVVLVTTEQV